MTKAEITIRAAATADVPAIRRLLHCEGRSMDEAVIAANLASFYVLAQGMKLLGVYYCGQDGSPAWTAVHPLFGQRLVEEILTKAVNGLVDTDLPRRSGVREWSFSLTSGRSFRSISN